VSNGADTIADALDSVAAQQDVSLENVVIDRGSTDGTSGILCARAGSLGRLVMERDGGIGHEPGLTHEALFPGYYALWTVAFNTTPMLETLLSAAHANADGSRHHSNCEPTH